MKTSRLFHISARHAHAHPERCYRFEKKRQSERDRRKGSERVKYVQAMDGHWVVQQDVLRALLDVIEMMRCYI